MKKIILSAEAITCLNKRNIGKPNEDSVIADVENGIYILLDGITRPHSEYVKVPNISAARDVSDLFAKEAYDYLAAHFDESDKEALLRGAVRHANERLLLFRSTKTLAEWEFYPATLGIVAIVSDGVFHYISVGDCMGVLFRGNSRMLFGKELTLEGVDLLNPTKSERYEKYCNRYPAFLSYSVFNGDECVADNAEYSFFSLEASDCILLVSDGAANLIKYEQPRVLKSIPLDELLLASEKYDVPPFGKYADDKSIIRIVVR